MLPILLACRRYRAAIDERYQDFATTNDMLSLMLIFTAEHSAWLFMPPFHRLLREKYAYDRHALCCRRNIRLYYRDITLAALELRAARTLLRLTAGFATPVQEGWQDVSRDAFCRRYHATRSFITFCRRLKCAYSL